MNIHIRSLCNGAITAAFVLMAAGCQTHSMEPMGLHGAQTDVDHTFARGAGRAPTARTMYATAQVFATQGRDAEAHFVLTRLIQTYPDFLPAYNELAELHMRRDRFDQARAALNAGLAIKPDDAVMINNLGMCDLIQGRYADALADFNRAVAMDPHNARYTANRALALGLMGEYDQALNLYKQIMPPGEAHHNIAICSAARRDYQRAAHERSKAMINGFAVPREER